MFLLGDPVGTHPPAVAACVSHPPSPLDMAHYPPLARERFPREILTHGDPDRGQGVVGGIISRTSGMEELEADFRNRALLASVQGRRSAISLEAMV